MPIVAAPETAIASNYWRELMLHEVGRVVKAEIGWRGRVADDLQLP